MFSSRKRSAFTLVELLVVIVIISIIAAIVFPLIARNREKSRANACISNERQISRGFLTYAQDHDEAVPPNFLCTDGEELALNDQCHNYSKTSTWVNSITPYVHDKQTFRCPDLEKNPLNIWGSKPKNKYPTYTELPAYGYNYAYLTPENGDKLGGCPTDAGYTDGVNAIPVKMKEIEAPAQTVLFTDVKNIGDDKSNYFPSWGADPPSTKNACYWGGWGVGAAGDDSTVGGYLTYTGIISPRHNHGVNVSFCDGHVQWLTPARLAAGTNWYIGVRATDIDITDLSKYLWSLKKTGGSDL